MRHPNWKQRSPNGHLNDQGYRLIYRPKHPNAKKNGAIFEHRFVMSEILGRPLTKDEVVHHKNKPRDDNRPENLELWLKSHPPGQRVEDLVRYAREILQRYGSLYSEDLNQSSEILKPPLPTILPQNPE
jgi:hypothetical protein